MIDRRNRMRSALVEAGAFGFGRINPEYLYRSSFATEIDRCAFLARSR